MMKKLKIWSMMMLMVMALPMMVACGGGDEDTTPITKSQLIGTWYAINEGWILVFTQHELSRYEFYGTPGDYKLKPGYDIQHYTIDEKRIITEKGEAFVSIKGNTMSVTGNSGTLIYTKYNGKPQQLIDYLNGK
jgi:hypothetical protein